MWFYSEILGLKDGLFEHHADYCRWNCRYVISYAFCDQIITILYLKDHLLTFYMNLFQMPLSQFQFDMIDNLISIMLKQKVLCILCSLILWIIRSHLRVIIFTDWTRVHVLYMSDSDSDSDLILSVEIHNRADGYKSPKVDIRPQTWWLQMATVIFLRSLCSYLWVNALILSLSTAQNKRWHQNIALSSLSFSAQVHDLR